MSTLPRPRIALISAVTAAIGPAVGALEHGFPDAETWNILDDRLLSDADSAGGLSDELRARMERLIAHAIIAGADGILLTCSLYGTVAEQTQADIPVLSPDEAAIADIVEAGYPSVLVVASFDGARDDSVARLREALRRAGRDTTVSGLSVPAAMTASKAGDHAALVRSLNEAVAANATPAGAIFLAQYSLAPAGEELAQTTGVPVISGPASSAAALRAAIER